MRALVVIALALPSAAHAGPSSYGWLPATEVVEADHVEAGGWIYERDDRGHLHERATVLGGAPTFGLTDSLELRLPFELIARSAVEDPPSFGLARFGGEARYRFTRRGAALAPLARVALARDVEIRSLIRTELGVALGFEQGIVHVEGTIDLVAEINRSSMHYELHPGIGASVRLRGPWRAGGELYSEVSLDSFVDNWLALGPNLSARFGRSWFSAALGIGLSGITFAPRINWGFGW
ncbi:MAG TPA: hypothetical protein VIV40_38090 [Kofleriaceae bacterium]